MVGVRRNHYWLEAESDGVRCVLDLNFSPDQAPYEAYADYQHPRSGNTRGSLPARSDPTLPNRLESREIVLRVRELS
jgi:hypothetical protein